MKRDKSLEVAFGEVRSAAANVVNIIACEILDLFTLAVTKLHIKIREARRDEAS